MSDKTTKINICICGDAKVGKSEIIKKYMHKPFTNEYKETNAVDLEKKITEIGSRIIDMSIWDFPGEERYRSIPNSIYKLLNCYLLVFDVNNMDSFSKLKEMYKKELLFYIDDKPIILIGNKIDKTKEEIKNLCTENGDISDYKEEIINWCTENGNIPYIETSAKDGTNINIIFNMAIEKSLLNINDDGFILI